MMPSQTPGKESSGCDAESVMPDSVSLGDDLHISNSAAWQTQLSLDQLKNSQMTNPYGSIETPSPITNDLPIFDGTSTVTPQHTPNPNTHGHNVQILSSPVHQVPGPPPVSSTSAATNPVPTRNRNRNSVSDTSFKEFGSSMFDVSFKLTIHFNYFYVFLGLISMKKGFSNFMTSIDTALKTNTADDASDTFSIQSDISSDSENFIMVLADDKTADCMDVMFRYK